jgi:Skp family chaperone for outer membrane proteins
VGSQEGKRAIADLQVKYEPRQQEIVRLQKDIQGLQDRLNGATVGDEDRRRWSRDLEDKQTQLKRSTDDAQSDFAIDRDNAVRRIGQKMVRIITDYAQQKGLTLVIDGAQMPIYYAASGIDITPEVVKLYDAANPVAGAEAAGKPAAKPAASSPAKPK